MTGDRRRSNSSQGENMEFLVTTTTVVPVGTLDATVAGLQAGNAECWRDLAARGHLARLWHPARPLDVWRTIGLFVAQDDDELEKLLASAPLHSWQTHDVTTLFAHPNDPVLTGVTSTHVQKSEFLIAAAVKIPEGTAQSVVDDARAREARRSRELAEQGRLERLWSVRGVPGRPPVLGLWGADDATEMDATVESLPMHDWMTFDISQLASHPGDPASNRSSIDRLTTRAGADQ
jgi:muconolactone delta-isomerase